MASATISAIFLSNATSAKCGSMAVVWAWLTRITYLISISANNADKSSTVSFEEAMGQLQNPVQRYHCACRPLPALMIPYAEQSGVSGLTLALTQNKIISIPTRPTSKHLTILILVLQ